MSILLGDLLIRLAAESGDTQEFIATLQAAKARLQEADAALKSTSAAMGDLNAKAGAAASVISAVSAAAAPVATNLNATGTAGQAAAAGLGAAGAAAGTAATALGQVGAAAPQVTAGLGAAGTAAQQTTSSFNSLFSAINGVGAVLQRHVIAGALHELEDVLSQVATGFKDAENEITRSTGAIGDRLGEFDVSLRKVITSSVQSADDIGKAMGKIASSLHLDPGPALEHITKEIADLSQVTGVAIGDLADKVSKVMKAFQVPVGTGMDSSIQHLLDVSQQTNTSVTTLLDNAQKFGPAFRTLGVPMDEVVSIIGKLNDNGINVQMTLSNMTLAMRFLAKEGAKDLLDALSLLFEKIKQAPTDGEAFAIGAATMGRASKDLVDAIREGRITIQDFISAAKGGGTELSAQAKSMETLAQKWQEAKNAIVAATGPFVGGELAGALSNVGTIVAGIAGAFTTVAGAIEKAKDNLSGFLNIEIPGGAQGPLFNFLMGPGLGGIRGGLKTGADLTSDIQLGIASGFFPGELPTNALDKFGPKVPTMEPETFYLGGTKIGTKAPPASATKHDPTSISAVQRLEDAMAKHLKGPGDKLPSDPEYKLLQAQVRILREQLGVGKQNMASLSQEFGDLADIAINSPDVADLARELVALNKSIADKQAFGLPVSADKYSERSARRFIKAEAGMDQESAQKYLGLENPDDVRNNARLIKEAFEELAQKGAFAPGYIALAWDAAQQKILAAARKIGDDVSPLLVLSADWAKTLADIQTMDFGSARQTLGLTTEGQAFLALAKESAAFEEILRAVNAGYATAIDLENAQVDLLSKEKAGLAAIGLALDDVSEASLNYLSTQKQIRGLSTEGALAFFGISSEQDLANALAKIDAAYTKVHQAATGGVAGNALQDSMRQSILAASGGAVDIGTSGITASVTALADLQAAYKASQDKITEWQKAGKVATNEMIQDFQDLGAQVKSFSIDLGRAQQDLGITTVAAATSAIKTLNDELALIKAEYGESSKEFLAASASVYTQTLAFLQKSGQAVPAQLVADLNDTKQRVIATVQTIDQAYATLGLKSSSQIQNGLKQVSAALQEVGEEGSASAFMMFRAETAAAAAYYDARIQMGEKFDKQDKLLNDLMIERIRRQTTDATHYWSTFFNGITQSWNAFTSGLSTEIAGIINGTSQVIEGFNKWESAFIRIGMSIEQVFLNQIIKNLVLTDGLLNRLETGFLHLLGASPDIVNRLVPNLGGTAASSASSAGFTSAVTAAGTGFASAVSSAAAAWTATTEGGAASWAAEMEAVGATLSAEMDAAGAEVAALLDSSGVELAATLDGAGVALSAEIDGAGAGLAAEMDGAGAALAAEVDGAGGAFAAEIDSAGAALAAEIDGAGAAFAGTTAGAGASSGAFEGAIGAVGSLGSGASSGAGGIMSSLGGIAGIANIANLGVNIASGIVSGFQMAHTNDFLEKIELSTRYSWIATGEASDSISKTNITIAQKSTAMLDFMNGDLRQYLQNINVDLDAIAGNRTVSGPTNISGNFDLTPVTNQLAAIAALTVSVVNGINIVAQILRGFGSNVTAGGAGTQTNVHTDASVTATAPHAAVTDAVSSRSTVTRASSGTTYTNTQQAPNSTFDQWGNPLGTTYSNPATGPAFISLADQLVPRPTTTDPNLAAINQQLFAPTNPGDAATDFLGRIGTSLASLLQQTPVYQAGTDEHGNAIGPAPPGTDIFSLANSLGLHLSPGDFDSIIVPAAATILNSLLPDRSQIANLTDEQVSAVRGQFAVAFEQWLMQFKMQAQMSGLLGDSGQLIASPIPGTQRGTYQGGIGATVRLAGSAPVIAAYTPSPASSGLLNAGAFGFSPDMTHTPSLAEWVASLGPGGYMSSITGGAAAGIDPLSYTGRYLASQQPGYSASLPASVVAAGSSIRIPAGQYSGDVNDPNRYSYANAINPPTGNVTFIIKDNNFPVGMTDRQVADALARQMRTESALLR